VTPKGHIVEAAAVVVHISRLALVVTGKYRRSTLPPRMVQGPQLVGVAAVPFTVQTGWVGTMFDGGGPLVLAATQELYALPQLLCA